MNDKTTEIKIHAMFIFFLIPLLFKTFHFLSVISSSFHSDAQTRSIVDYTVFFFKKLIKSTTLSFILGFLIAYLL